MNWGWPKRMMIGGPILAAALVVCGCASISESTHAYLGTPQLAPFNPNTVQVFVKNQ